MTVDVRKGQRHTGEDCKVWPLGIPIAVPTIEAAIDQALEKGGGNLMIDQVTYLSQYTWIIASQICMRVEGTVVNTTAAK